MRNQCIALWGSRLLLASATSFVMTSGAFASISYSFDPSSGSGQTISQNIPVGGSQSVPVYLVFTGTDASSLSTEKGLFSADVQLFRTAGGSQPVGIPNAASVVGNTAEFDDASGPIISYTSAGDVDLFQSINTSRASGVVGQSIPSGGTQILLGTFTFKAGNIIGESTTFAARDFPDSSDTITFTNRSALDASIGSATLTFTTVPEPGCIFLFVCAATILAGYRHPRAGGGSPGGSR